MSISRFFPAQALSLSALGINVTLALISGLVLLICFEFQDVSPKPAFKDPEFPPENVLIIYLFIFPSLKSFL